MAEEVEPSGALFVAIEDLTIKDSVDCLDTEENLTTPGIKEDVTRPRCDAAPSPIIRDDEEIPDRILDITPMDQSEGENEAEYTRNCSSPVLPKIDLIDIENAPNPEEDKGFVRIVKNCSKGSFPVRPMARPKSTLFDLSYAEMPEEIFPPKAGSEGKVAHGKNGKASTGAEYKNGVPIKCYLKFSPQFLS